MKSSLLTLAVILLIAASAVAIIWTSKNMEGQISRRVATSLETVLNTTQQSLRVWQQETLLNASIIANSDEIRAAIQKQAALPHRYADVVRSASLRDLRQKLRPYVDRLGYIDFEVISRDSVQIASGQTDLLGQTTIADMNREFLDSIFAGITQIWEPLRLPSQFRRTTSPANMALGVPVFNDQNEVIAALIFRLDPAKEFTPLTSIGWLGRTGDLYIFDKQARLLTSTRFKTAPGTELRDPGGDTTEGFRSNRPAAEQPLTRMAAAAIQGSSGIDLDGYRDYRGVPVVGTWVWNSELGLGLAAEMEVSEAYAPMRTIRLLSLVMIAVVTTAVFLLMRVMAHRARLQTTNFGYQQALKARQDLLAIVAHDLKNPINSVALSSSALVKMLELPKPDIGFIVQNLGVIHRSAFRMNRLIEDLLVSSRVEAGQFRIRQQECDLHSLLNELQQMVSPLIAEKSIEFLCSIGPDVPRAFVDPDRLTQVLSNLVGNAIKFSPAHGVVSVSVQSCDGEIQFCVADSGPGIPTSELPRIFDQYWQAQQNKTGSGLGLYISKGLVEAHGGRIWVESAVGEGTSVYFMIPQTSARHQVGETHVA